MKSSDIIKIFSQPANCEAVVDTTYIESIINNGIVIHTGIDKDYNYYYRVSLIDIINSDIDDNTLTNMHECGWKLSKDKKYIEFIG